MKSNKQHKDSKTQIANPAYGEQDFDQGRAGIQSGFEGQAESFSQFQNAGDASFAAERTKPPNSLPSTLFLLPGGSRFFQEARFSEFQF
ncbi:MAG: hypothetical protein EOO06_16070 [Chitinophagaceae bacterium]|nr:MAG: hypothetical protein EOO06_16070 [Chitinophagaceae bacterium]